jgi:23S rRNA G2069 N7-methylase RlmK/C1962 C5-methylase RlmI
MNGEKMNGGHTNSEETSGNETSGVRFHYDGLEGQKTGAFLDQREN